MFDSTMRRDVVTEKVNASDQIILSDNNYEEFDSKLDPRRLSPAFVQENRLKGTMSKFELYNKTYLFQTRRHYRDQAPCKYRINLAWLDPKPETVQVIAWNWVSAALATAIWATVFFYVAYFTDLKIEYVESAGVLMSTLTVISLCLFFYYSEHKLVFNSYLSNVPLIEIDLNKPDKLNFDTFVHDIRSGIYAGWQNKDIQQMLVGEIRELRRLRDEGILSEDTYLRARTEILNHREYQIKSAQVDSSLQGGEASAR